MILFLILQIYYQSNLPESGDLTHDFNDTSGTLIKIIVTSLTGNATLSDVNFEVCVSPLGE